MRSDIEPKYHGGNLLTMPRRQFNEMMAWMMQQAVVKGEFKHDD